MAWRLVVRLLRDSCDRAERLHDVDSGWGVAVGEFGRPDGFVEIRGQKDVGARRVVIVGGRRGGGSDQVAERKLDAGAVVVAICHSGLGGEKPILPRAGRRFLRALVGSSAPGAF